MFWKFVFSLFIFCLPKIVFSAPCCAGAGVFPAMVIGDHKAQVSAVVSQSNVIADTPEKGLPVWRKNNHAENTRTLRIDAVHVFEDLWQAGITLPINQRSLSNSATTTKSNIRLGDIQATGAYEFLPEWSYSLWKPRGYVFTSLVVPTGRSIYEAEEVGAVDANGRGFWIPSVGVFFTKTWGIFDAYLLTEIHRSIPRSFEVDGEELRVDPRWGGSVGLGAGVSPFRNKYLNGLRFGLRIQPSYNQSKSVTINETKLSSDTPQKVCDTAAEINYLLFEDWSFFAVYNDQTLLGPAQNTTLSRTLALGAQYRVPR